jgi:hypothetical protein
VKREPWPGWLDTVMSPHSNATTKCSVS